VTSRLLNVLVALVLALLPHLVKAQSSDSAVTEDLRLLPGQEAQNARSPALVSLGDSSVGALFLDPGPDVPDGGSTTNPHVRLQFILSDDGGLTWGDPVLVGELGEVPFWGRRRDRPTES
jgi:hypothetical protein